MQISGDDMSHIANNLIENAIKYNVPEGSVMVQLAIDGEDVVLAVEDTGIGIPLRTGREYLNGFTGWTKPAPGKPEARAWACPSFTTLSCTPAAPSVWRKIPAAEAGFW